MQGTLDIPLLTEDNAEQVLREEAEPAARGRVGGLTLTSVVRRGLAVEVTES